MPDRDAAPLWTFAVRPEQGSFNDYPSSSYYPSAGASSSRSGGLGASHGHCGATHAFGAAHGSHHGASSHHGPKTSMTVRYEVVKERSGPAAPDEVSTLSDGKRYGAVERVDGAYVGDLDGDSRRDGWGTLTYLTGDVYTGQFKEGKRCGYGELRYAAGGRHAGLWANDVPEGCGAFTDASGAIVHDGNWAAGVPAEYKIDTSVSVVRASMRFKALLRPKK